MLYVMTLKWRPGLSGQQRDEAQARRARWSYPDAVKLHAEYWPASEHMGYIAVFETDSFEAISEMTHAWRDVFRIDVAPAAAAGGGAQSAA